MSEQGEKDLNYTLGEVRGTVTSLVSLVNDLSNRLHEVEKRLWYICGGSVVVGTILAKIDWLGLAVHVAEAATR